MLNIVRAPGAGVFILSAAFWVLMLSGVAVLCRRSPELSGHPGCGESSSYTGKWR